jgi:membrane protease YdiL (CAAX protease family)
LKRKHVVAGEIMDEKMTGDNLAAELRGFGPVGMLAVLAIFLVGNYPFALLGALLVLLWAWSSRTSWRDLGFTRPRSWALTIIFGVAIGIVLKFAMKAVVMPLLGADPVNQAFHYLSGNRGALPFAIYAVVVGAGFGEETFFRGFLFERFGKLFRERPYSKILIVAITSAWFALSHYSLQGLAGVEQALFTGVALGTIVAVTGSIWMAMIAHAAFDLTALAMIYWNVETTVAHYFFS